MDEYKKFHRTQFAEATAWYPGFDMTDVSVSSADFEDGSPKTGDMIARNPVNHKDRWLIAADYFETNFKPFEERT